MVCIVWYITAGLKGEWKFYHWLNKAERKRVKSVQYKTRDDINNTLFLYISVEEHKSSSKFQEE